MYPGCGGQYDSCAVLIFFRGRGAGGVDCRGSSPASLPSEGGGEEALGLLASSSASNASRSSLPLPAGEEDGPDMDGWIQQSFCFADSPRLKWWEELPTPPRRTRTRVVLMMAGHGRRLVVQRRSRRSGRSGLRRHRSRRCWSGSCPALHISLLASPSSLGLRQDGLQQPDPRRSSRHARGDPRRASALGGGASSTPTAVRSPRLGSLTRASLVRQAKIPRLLLPPLDLPLISERRSRLRR